MKIIAKAKFVQGSPRKMRLVADAIRNLDTTAAISVLKSLPQRSAKPILKVYLQGLGNAKHNFSFSPADLQVDSLQINEGPRLKRRDAHAHGARFDSGVRHKKMSHIVLSLVSKKEARGSKS